MAGMESLVKFAVGLVGIPLLTSTVGRIYTAKAGLEKVVQVSETTSARLQALPVGNHLTKNLQALLHVSAGQYGGDCLFFTLSAYDGAMKALDSQSGVLYLIEIDAGTADCGLAPGQQFLIWGKSGISQIHVPGRSYKVLAELVKSGTTVSAEQLTDFFRPLGNALIAQEARIRTAFRNARPGI